MGLASKALGAFLAMEAGASVPGPGAAIGSALQVHQLPLHVRMHAQCHASCSAPGLRPAAMHTGDTVSLRPASDHSHFSNDRPVSSTKGQEYLDLGEAVVSHSTAQRVFVINSHLHHAAF